MGKIIIEICLISFCLLFAAGCGGGSDSGSGDTDGTTSGTEETTAGTEESSGGEEDTPLEISSLTATAGYETVSLSWAESGTAGRVEITWSPDGTAARSVDAGSGTFTATGLALGTEYTFTATSIDGDENVTAQLTAAATPCPEGTPADAVYIRTIAGLKAIDDDPAGYYVLLTDLDLTGENVASLCIGDGFSGTLDGNGHILKHLEINETDSRHGLFSRITESGVVMNLGLEDASVSGTRYIGGLAGYNAGTISNCHTSGSSDVTSTDTTFSHAGGLVGYNDGGDILDSYSECDVYGYGPYVGGLVGYNTGFISGASASGSIEGAESVGGLAGCNASATISGSEANCEVSGAEKTGGLVGYNDGGDISNCNAGGTVAGSDYDAGGLVGLNHNDGQIDLCYAIATVNSDASSCWYVGGLVGRNVSDSTITRSFATGNTWGAQSVGGLIGYSYNAGETANCYATGSATGTGDYIGGLVGRSTGSYFTHCYAVGIAQSTGNYIGGLAGSIGSSEISNCYFNETNTGNDYGTATSLENMKYQSTFSGWDFVDESANGEEEIWSMDDSSTDPLNSGYPYLTDLPPDE